MYFKILEAIESFMSGSQGLEFLSLPYKAKSSPEVMRLPWGWGLELQQIMCICIYNQYS